jgi:FtsZ-binding cell division protein ZapB
MPATKAEDLSQVPHDELVERNQELGREVDAINEKRQALVGEIARRAQERADKVAALEEALKEG